MNKLRKMILEDLVSPSLDSLDLDRTPSTPAGFQVGYQSRELLIKTQSSSEKNSAVSYVYGKNFAV